MVSGQNPINVPEIDLSNLKPMTPEWDSARSQIWKAVEEFGCFRVVFNKIPQNLPNSILNELKELFDLPLETKKLTNHITDLYGGYVGKSLFGPLYESIGFDDPFMLEKVEKLINAILPPGKPEFCKHVHDLAKLMSEMETMIVRMVMESLGVEKYLDEHCNSVFHALRVQKYEIPQKGEVEVALNIHKDQDVMTILYQSQIDALEVETRDGKWVDVKPSSDNFMVVIGETLHAWTNGRAHSPYHRVIMRGNRPRYSTGLFTAFKAGFVIKAPEELVDEQNPLLYKPFDHFEFLKLIKRDAEHYETNPNPSYIPLIAYYGIDV
ncbi:hypothetical protein JCGZ_06221 [Jatropha curcas]|uniref:Fe2OG dioxygenase domain-containing protein n=1 Tax=Jatropha curcas TaxID=180498 RepID=A0A067KY25_JATCU|nr:probable 2-oxoglutarate-dependent dioxygenase AOP1 [Jatropha curcas]KDP37165.1 hypothetical protein JCGZ_06221 [Jatropha curcas]